MALSRGFAHLVSTASINKRFVRSTPARIKVAPQL
jgi:hypothetical protein